MGHFFYIKVKAAQLELCSLKPVILPIPGSPYCHFTLKAILCTLSKPLGTTQEQSLNHSSIPRIGIGLHNYFTLGQWTYRQWCGDRGCPRVAWRGPWVRGQGTKLCSSPPGCCSDPEPHWLTAGATAAGTAFTDSGQSARRQNRQGSAPGPKSLTQGSFQTTQREQSQRNAYGSTQRGWFPVPPPLLSSAPHQQPRHKASRAQSYSVQR